MKRTRLAVILSFLLVFQSFAGATLASASVFGKKVDETSTQLSPGVTYVEQTFNGSTTKQEVNILNVDLNDPFTFLDVGIPYPLNATATVSQHAAQNHREGNFVIGATNGGFFDTNGKYPVNLIAKDNQLINLGVFGLTKKSPTNAPIAFGLNSNGKAIIEQYELNFDVSVGDFSQKLTKINTTREDGAVVFYTRPKQTTGTNEWGTEIVISDVTPSPQNLTIGQSMTGIVSKITRFGEGGNATIPANGFVISAHGEEWAEKLQNINEGDSATIQFNLGDVWQDAKYIIGTGPLLVKNGQVSISMDESQSFAKDRHPRTAIATNKAGDEIFLITVDGRQNGVSSGANLRDLANYLISLGAYHAINLDGGGSTAMVVRQLGGQKPTLVNNPSGGTERKVSTIFQVISTAPTSEPKTLKLTKPDGKILKGTEVPLTFKYAIDKYMNPVSIDVDDIRLSVDGGIGDVDDMTFTAERAGSGKVIAKYDDAYGELPITVVDSFDKIEILPKSVVIGVDEAIQLTANALNNSGEALLYDRSLIKWSVEGGIGEISADGMFTAGSEKAAGNIVASYGNITAKIPVKVGADPVLIDGFESIANWSADQAKASASVRLSENGEPVKDGKTSIKLSYDFTTSEEGIKAAYVAAKTPIQLQGNPKELGVWVYGDGAEHWLRASVIDGTGKKHTINFTEEGGLTWQGWKYVRAQMPANLLAPVKFDRIYVAEAVKEKQNKGEIYIDRLIAAYVSNHSDSGAVTQPTQPVDPTQPTDPTVPVQPEPQPPVVVSFKDVPSNHWAYKSIGFLSSRNTIRGFEDGTFRPSGEITRAMAAAMIAREFNLTESDNPLKFTDVKANHYAYNAIKAVSEKGLINGRTATEFAPDAPLSRAEMAAVLVKAYNLSGKTDKTFADVSTSHWASAAINALAANGITGGFEDGTYRPSKPTTRAEFSSFMERVIKLQNK
ncbi:S-layer homology domain-containing protein [Calidifontibacillus oryziterrae]|uniref:S-layer homology domain-containing protein n=1 Tax=Calidifontibacillus oryziterrae TaxID=1191699 RepID=UPI0002FE9369|nr:S-layer homology domain-containing protein [Calidifontibacillus oryziterrae]